MRYFSDDQMKDMEKNLGERSNLSKHLNLIGHRGICNDLVFRENTLNVFKKAIVLGVDGIELDVFTTSSGILVVSHDEISQNIFFYNEKIEIEEESSPGISTETSPHLSTEPLCPILTYQDEDEEEPHSVELIVQNFNELKIDTSGNLVPSLFQVLELIEEANDIRRVFNLPPLSLHIDFKQTKSENPKDSLKIFNAVLTTVMDIFNYQQVNTCTNIQFKDIYFCSFNQAALMYLNDLFSGKYSRIPKTNFKFAVSVDSKAIFGEENVSDFYRVSSGADYKEENLKALESVFLNQEAFVAYDFILWDISRPLINIVLLRKKDMFVSATNWQNYRDNQEAVVFLLTLGKEVNTYFKCDDFGELIACYKVNKNCLMIMKMTANL
jgi:glycerophosphoryl diester phosphodiesterase